MKLKKITENMNNSIKNKIKKIKKKLNKIITKLKLEENKFNSLELMLIFIMALSIGLFLGEMIFSGSGSKEITITKKNNVYINEIEKVYNTILEEYINKLDEDKLKEAAINGMMSLLGDNYSSYYDEKETDAFKEELQGYFYGIGTEIYQEKDDLITINRVFENSPAAKAGLKKGDKYLKVNGQDVTKKTITEVSELIKGKNGKKFSLTIKRGNETKTVELTTGKIEIESVTSDIIKKDNQKIGYMKISIFASNTDEQFEKHLLKMDKEKISKLIIDVRANSGGELETVINIASNFMNKNDVIVQTVSKEKTTKRYSVKDNNKKYELVVLINGGSASGSEVLAAALNENCKADLVGTTTYGKGTVQKTKSLSGGTMIKYTIETWKTPKSKEIDGKGIEPTVEVKLDKKYYETLNTKDDNQYQKAIEIILKK